MQAVEHVDRLVEHKTPLGAPIPENFEHYAKRLESTVYISEPPITHRFKSILQEFNQTHNLATPMTAENAVEVSRQWEPKYLRWQAIRHMGKGYRLTGHEPFYLGKEVFGRVDDTDAISLTISFRGLELQQQKPDITNRLLTVGLQGLTIPELNEVNGILREMLDTQKEAMSRAGEEFRTGVREVINGLNPMLRTIYYYRGQQERIQSVYALPDRIPELGPLKGTNWQRVLEIAEENNIAYGLDDLKRGRDIIKLYSQGIDPLTRVFMTSPQ